MGIRFKTLGIIAASLLLSVIANLLALDQYVWPSFISLERKETERDMERVKQLIAAEIDDVHASVWDYASWDDTWAYAQDRNPEYAELYLATDSLINMGVDFIELYDSRGERIFHAVFDRENQRMTHEPWSIASLDPQGLLFAHQTEDSSVTGIIRTPRGPLLIASRPIVKTSGEGPIAGTFLFGRFLDERLVAALHEKTKVDFAAIDLDAVDATRDLGALARLQDPGEDLVIDETSNRHLTAYGLLRDYAGQPILLVKAQMARDIASIGRRALLASIAGVVVAGILIMIVTGLLLQWLLVGPLIRLTRHVVEIGDSGAFGRRIGSTRSDELGILSREFDKMLASLKEARDRLLENSYQSGIAEMASGVLHNLRNQLAPLNMRVDRIREALVPTGDGKVDRALQELGGSETGADRRSKLATYVALHVANAAENRARLREDLSQVTEDLHRVDGVLRELDRFSHMNVELEEVFLADAVERTIAALPAFPDVRVTYEIEPSLAAQPPVHAAGFILEHVLSNLFVNAVESIIAAGRDEGRIIVTGAISRRDGQAFVALQVQDNGAGINAADLDRIFTRGFSTKPDHTGIGLHWSANRIAALHGKISADSPGPDRGATFHLLLPMAETTAKAAA